MVILGEGKVSYERGTPVQHPACRWCQPAGALTNPKMLTIFSVTENLNHLLGDDPAADTTLQLLMRHT